MFYIVLNRLSGRTGRSVGTTRNSAESGRSRVQSQVADGTRYGEFSSGGRNPKASRQKSVYQNLTTPTKEKPSMRSGFSQYSFLANPCKINPVLILLYIYDVVDVYIYIHVAC